jgi:hypothetical protein
MYSFFVTKPSIKSLKAGRTKEGDFMTCRKARQLISQITKEQKQALTHITNCDDCECFFLEWLIRIVYGEREIPGGHEICSLGMIRGRELDAEVMNRMKKAVKESVLRSLDKT